MQGFLMFFAWGAFATGVVMAGVNIAALLTERQALSVVSLAVIAAWVLGGFFWFVLCKSIADALDELAAIRSRLR